MTDPWNEHLERLLDLSPAGAGSSDLSLALRAYLQAWNDPTLSGTALDDALDAAVVDIAAALAWDLSEAHLASDRFRQEAQEESHKEIKKDFIGSKEHLLFGLLVGEVLNLAYVFAALLSPTGGMVGPGGFSFHVKGGVLGYHGVAHDAGGYLCRCHSKDPGYEYINVDPAQPCEDNPVAGQISGIAFWFKLLHLSWLNFLAAGPPPLGPAPLHDIDSFLQPRPLDDSEIIPPEIEDTGGVLLNPAELRFLQVLITREADPPDLDIIAVGLDSLLRRELLSGSEQDGYTVNDQLILATAVSLEPELILDAAPAEMTADPDAAGQGLRFYKWGDYLVEQTAPSERHLRLAGLRDGRHAQERLLQVMPLTDTDLAALSLSLSDDEFDTAVSTAATGTIELGAELSLDSAEIDEATSETVSDLTTALDSGQPVGSIRIQQFSGKELTQTRTLDVIQGKRATWLISRSSQQLDQVDISMSDPAAIGLDLGLSPLPEN